MTTCPICSGTGFRRAWILVTYTGGTKFSHKKEERITFEEYERLNKIVDGTAQRVYTGVAKCECVGGESDQRKMDFGKEETK